MISLFSPFFVFFFFNDTATTEIYTLSLHDALPISLQVYRVRTRSPMKGVTLNAASARCAFYGSREVVFRARRGGLVSVTLGAPPVSHSSLTWGRMTEATQPMPHQLRIYALIAVVCSAAAFLLLTDVMQWPGPFPSRYWNGLAAFAI